MRISWFYSIAKFLSQTKFTAHKINRKCAYHYLYTLYQNSAQNNTLYYTFPLLHNDLFRRIGTCILLTIRSDSKNVFNCGTIVFYKKYIYSRKNYSNCFLVILASSLCEWMGFTICMNTRQCQYYNENWWLVSSNCCCTTYAYYN